MFDTARIKQDFSKAAIAYNDNANLQIRVLRTLVAKIAPLLSPDAQLLDAGCGTGNLAELLPHAHITQLDISHAMCNEAKKNGKPTIAGTIETLPFADNHFDAAVSSLVLQWLPAHAQALKELTRVTKKGGVIAVSTLGAGTLKELRYSFAEIDAYPHVSPFVKATGEWQKEIITDYFPSFEAVVQNLKAIGASNKLTGRRKGLLTKRALQRAEHFYREQFANAAGFPVTWEVLYQVIHP